ncbi:hypothetical protein AUJ68_04560 [Candidatus Woesearchaeota archaeon CG1_02_57_44]|nr:MAG: hypothetical protein AUJ68_04560 [Candidatus Woesearchaeota archaeon CG1_02_57_44]PIN70912.1 MAG: hypothetical protein COV94_00615 [Candidatus Woesearchaeota archaeon CG11_big_fil_rev_8_21_14_0_20_57_5]
MAGSGGGVGKATYDGNGRLTVNDMTSVSDAWYYQFAVRSKLGNPARIILADEGWRSARIEMMPVDPVGSRLLLATRSPGGSILDGILLDEQGRVGIGATNPSAKLEVAGSIVANNVSAYSYALDGNNKFFLSNAWGASFVLEYLEEGNPGYPAQVLKFNPQDGKIVFYKDVVVDTIKNAGAGYENGSAFVCVDNSGKLFALEVPCP